MLKIRNHISFPDTADALKQVEDAFAGRAATLEGRDKLSLIGVLYVSVHLKSPLAGDRRARRGSYHKPTETYFVEAYADYGEWIVPDWRRRTENYAGALRDAIGRVAKTRLPELERTSMLRLIDRLVDIVAASPPEDLKPLQSIELHYIGDNPVPSISFGSVGGINFVLPGTRTVEVWPEDAEAVAASLPKRAPQEPQAFKLYKRDGDGLRYHEAWANEGEITEHWGICGEEGNTSPHAYASLAAGEKIMRAIKNRARETGFSSLASSRHRQLVIELPVDGFGTPDDLDTRHELEDYLNNRLGWLGLGHVDGGSTGSGTMEVFCIVPDLEIAKSGVEAELAKLGVDNARLYEMK